MKKTVTWFSLTVITIFAMFICVKMTELEPTYEGVSKVILENTVQETGALNSVSAVVFDFRGYDTLGEAFVLFTAITASAVVLRKPVKSLSEKSKGGSCDER